MNGSREQFTARELLDLYRHPITVAFLLALCAAVIVLQPFEDVANFGPVEAAILWGFVFTVSLATYLGGLVILARFLAVVPSILALALTAAAVMSTAPEVSILLGGWTPSLTDRLTIFFFGLVVLIVCELCLVTFVFPLVRRVGKIGVTPGFTDLSGKVIPQEEPSPPGEVVLLGQKFDLSKLRAVYADEHYVHIATTEGTTMLRGRISDIEAQLPESVGMRVHRSHWIAAEAVGGLQCEQGSWRLKLLCGTVVPVARARRDAVRAWVASLDPGRDEGAR